MSVSEVERLRQKVRYLERACREWRQEADRLREQRKRLRTDMRNIEGVARLGDCECCNEVVDLVERAMTATRERVKDPCESCLERQADQVCSGPDVDPWRLCDACMAEHVKECPDLFARRAVVERINGR